MILNSQSIANGRFQHNYIALFVFFRPDHYLVGTFLVSEINLMNYSVVVDLADIVHQGKQAPLDIRLGFCADCEAVQAFQDTDIGKYRLDDGQSSGIDLFAKRV